MFTVICDASCTRPTKSVQFASLQSLDRLGHRGDMTNDSAEILFQSFLQEAVVSSSGTGRDVHSLTRPPRFSYADHGIVDPPRYPEGWFGEAFMARDTPQPREFPSLDSCQKMFAWAHKEVGLALHPVVGLVFQAGDVEMFLLALGRTCISLS